MSPEDMGQGRGRVLQPEGSVSAGTRKSGAKGARTVRAEGAEWLEVRVEKQAGVR